ncbi:MAG: mechanosensitive ion channel family protein, partial [Candidatus Sericytochromatia bacterium]
MRQRLWLLLATWLVLLLAPGVGGAALAAAVGQPVTLNGRPVLTVGESPSLSATERAGILDHRLAEILTIEPPPQWHVEVRPGGVQVLAGEKAFSTITAADIELNAAESAEALGARWVTALGAAVDEARYEHSLQYLATAVGIAVGMTLLAFLLIRFSADAHARVRAQLRDEASPVIARLFGWMNRVPYFEGIDVRPGLETLNVWGVWLVRLAIFNTWLLVVLGLFPQTRPFNALLLTSIIEALGTMGRSVVAYLPNMVTIAITVVVARYAIRLVQFVFSQMRARPEDLGFGLPVELIDALGKLATVVVWVFGAMVIAPLLPGLGTQTGQVIGLIVGAMITLGSGSTVGNAVAGFVLTYMRPFEVGDRVRVGEHEGDVIERNFTNVRLRTIKNEIVTLTSNHVLASALVNYTTDVSRQRGLILHTTVTIGYDVPRRKTEALLLEAATRTEAIIDEPAAFVLVTALGDFSISYELNASTPYPHRKAETYSELHKHILDVFSEAGVEIMSPTYHAVRDGHHTTV